MEISADLLTGLVVVAVIAPLWLAIWLAIIFLDRAAERRWPVEPERRAGDMPKDWSL